MGSFVRHIYAISKLVYVGNSGSALRKIMNVSKIGEFGLIDVLRKQVPMGRNVVRGIGDDAAVLPYMKEKYLLLASLNKPVRAQLITLHTLYDKKSFLLPRDPWRNPKRPPKGSRPTGLNLWVVTITTAIDCRRH